MAGSSIQDVRGLTESNRQLLKQRGAIGEPEHVLCETDKQLIRSNDTEMEQHSVADSPIEHVEHQDEQRNDP
jgi:hypothetical protein